MENIGSIGEYPPPPQPYPRSKPRRRNLFSGGVTHIWDMGYWGVKNMGYGI